MNHSSIFPSGALSCFCAFAFVLAQPIDARAGVVYQETFGNATGRSVPLSQTNASWKLFAGESGEDETTQRLTVSSAGSAPVGGLSNVGTSRETLSGSEGVVYVSGSPETPAYALYVTTEMPIPASKAPRTTFQWYAGNNHENVTMRLAVCLGGKWYVTDRAFRSKPVAGAAAFGAQAELQSFAFSRDAGLWRDLEFVPGSTLAMSDVTTPSDLPDEDIVGFGLFVEGGTGTARFDSFTVKD